jgi:hypothetical protein
MSKLIHGFNSSYSNNENKKITIEGGDQPISSPGQKTSITLSLVPTKINVFQKNGDWPSKLGMYIEYNNDVVGVNNLKECTSGDYKNDKLYIIPDTSTTTSFSFDLFEKPPKPPHKNKSGGIGDPGATVTVGDEGDGIGEKKEKKKKALKNL